jgi:hypothetical protein
VSGVATIVDFTIFLETQGSIEIIGRYEFLMGLLLNESFPSEFVKNLQQRALQYSATSLLPRNSTNSSTNALLDVQVMSVSKITVSSVRSPRPTSQPSSNPSSERIYGRERHSQSKLSNTEVGGIVIGVIFFTLCFIIGLLYAMDEIAYEAVKKDMGGNDNSYENDKNNSDLDAATLGHELADEVPIHQESISVPKLDEINPPVYDNSTSVQTSKKSLLAASFSEPNCDGKLNNFEDISISFDNIYENEAAIGIGINAQDMVKDDEESYVGFSFEKIDDNLLNSPQSIIENDENVRG